MFRKIQDVCSRIAGAVVGGARGLISGGRAGFRYHWHAAGTRVRSHVVPFYAVAGMFYAAFRFAGKGAYAGGTQGLHAAVHYPEVVDHYYFANLRKQQSLLQKLEQLPVETLNFFLSPEETLAFEAQLAEMTDLEINHVLTGQYEAYKTYLAKVCPFSNRTVQQHHNPVILRNAQNVEYVYSYLELHHYVNRNVQADRETVLGSIQPLGPDNIISRQYPAELKEFVKSARAQLHPMAKVFSWDTHADSRDPELRTTPSSKRATSGAYYATFQGAPWSQRDCEMVLSPQETMRTPLLPR